MNTMLIKRYVVYSLGMKIVRDIINRQIGKSETRGVRNDIPSFKGILEIKHSLTGRIRMYIPEVKSEGASESIMQIEKVDGVEKIEVNTLIGTVLVEYDEELVSASLIVGIVVRVLGLEDQINREPRSMASKELKNLRESLNIALYEKSKGVLDLNTALIVALVVVGTRKTINSPNRPSGLNYIWWGYSLLRGL